MTKKEKKIIGDCRENLREIIDSLESLTFITAPERDFQETLMKSTKLLQRDFQSFDVLTS